MREFDDDQLPDHTVRLTFRYDGGEIELVDRELLEMLDAPSDAAPGPRGESGFWVELRDGEDRMLHRRVLADPFHQSVEVHFGKGESGRVPRAKQSGTFLVDLPDLPGADHLVVFSSAPPNMLRARAGLKPAVASEVSRMPLH